LAEPALGKDGLDPGKLIFGDIVRLSDFGVENRTIAVLGVDELPGLGAPSTRR
jgi:hypothetical protein